MKTPRWAAWIVRLFAPDGRQEDLLGDLEEAHRLRLRHRNRTMAAVLTTLEALDIGVALFFGRLRLGYRPGRRPTMRVAQSGSSRRWPAISWLDFKLGFRMLVRYPGLTIVGGLAIAFAIWVGVATFELGTQVLNSELPLEEGDRIVGIRLHNTATDRQRPQALYEFELWRDELASVEDLGAFRSRRRNLITGGGRGEPIDVVEMTASGFGVTRVPPLLGRTLDEADERSGSPRVVVIGHDLWQTRFDSDPHIVGTSVRLGNEQGTVVGVMPDGFGFPFNNSLWAPLRLDDIEYGRQSGPAARLFGRLAPGISLDEAQAELTTLGRALSVDFPDTHEFIRPEILPYPRLILGLSRDDSGGLLAVGLSLNVFIILLLVLVCGNVALLMFARAASRESELVVRNALGAGRMRIITQLFVEALVLGGVGAVVGLVGAKYGLRWAFGVIQIEILEGESLPFWFHDSLTTKAVLFAGVLTVIGALVAGVVPALKVTRAGLEARLRQASAGGGGIRFGGVWTFVIVSQVALTLTLPIVTYQLHRDMSQIRGIEAGFPSEQYLTARLEMDREVQGAASAEESGDAFRARITRTYGELAERLEAEPGISAVTFGSRLPGMYHPHRLVELDEGPAAPVDPRFSNGSNSYRVSSEEVDPEYFNTLEVPILAGRNFVSADVSGVPGTDPGVVIVNESFVDRVLGGYNPIGRRVRHTYFESQDQSGPTPEEPGPWYQIIGVVGDMATTFGDFDPKAAALYHPVAPSAAYPVQIALRAGGDPLLFVTALRVISADVDPTLQLHEIQRLDQVVQSELDFYSFWFWLSVIVVGLTVVVSLAGIYSVMSFTVAKRTREIGIRVALGSSHLEVVLAIFRRPIVQIGLGLVLGASMASALVYLIHAEVTVVGAALVALYGLGVGLVCMLACIVPIRRALGIEPTDALRVEG